MAFKVKINELPSLEKEPQITTSIKENPYKANVEIEKDELVVRPDLAAIYKAKGEKHSKGGIKTYLPDNSFVISDDKTLALSEEEHEMLELKMGGSSSPHKNTPADVLKRNLDVKHYNKMTSILTNPKKDEFSKRTAAMMLSKYEDVLGRVAFAQEAKKGFPTGLPEFSQDAAPVIADSLKENIEQQPQFMKKGGYTNPYLQMVDGGPKQKSLYFHPKQKNSPGELVKNKPLFGRLLGLEPDRFTYDPNMNNLLTFGKPLSNNTTTRPVSIPNTTNLPTQPINKVSQSISKPNGSEQLFSPALTGYGLTHNDMVYAPNVNNPFQFVDSLQHKKGSGTYGSDYDVNEFKSRHDWYFKDKQNWDAKNSNDVMDFQNQYNQITQKQIGEDYFGGPGFRAKDGKLGKYTYNAPNFFGKKPDNTLKTEIERPVQTVVNKPTPTPGADPNKITGEPADKKQLQPWEFSSWQKANMAASALDVASTRRDFAYRSQVKSPLVEMNRMNAQGALNNVDNNVFAAMQSNRGLNPYMAAGNAASIYGKGLDNKQQVQSQYDNQNIGIDNQQNQMNNQSQRGDAMANIGFDQQYYRESVNGRANFDNMKQTGRNRLREEVNKYAQDNQTLQYNMMTLDNPAFGYNYKDGQFYLTGKDPMNARNVQGSDMMSQYISKLAGDFDKMTTKERLEFAKIMTRGKGSSPFAKKGGKINPYKK